MLTARIEVHMRTITMFVLICLAGAAHAQDPARRCQLPNGSFSLVPLDPQIGFKRFGAEIGPLRSVGHFVFVNLTGKPIRRILILMEFLDQKDQHVISIPFYAGAVTAQEEEAEQERFPLYLLSRGHIDIALGAGQSIVLQGLIDAITSRCPVKAQASLVEISFSDGTKLEHQEGHSEVEPSIMEAKRLDLATFPGHLPSEERLEITIGPDGRVSGISTLSDEKIKEWFETELSKWSFSPELKDRTPVACKLTLIFRLDVKDISESTYPDVSGMQMVIDVARQAADGTAGESILVGGIPLNLPNER